MARRNVGRDVNQSELCTIFGFTPPTVRSWEAMGCPVVEKGRKGKPAIYNTAVVFAWREKQILLGASGDAASIDYEEAKRRKMVAEAILAEIEADLRAGAAVLIEDVVMAVVNEYGVIRTNFINLGSSIATELLHLKEAEQAKGIVDGEVIRILEALTEDAKAKRVAKDRKREVA